MKQNDCNCMDVEKKVDELIKVVIAIVKTSENIPSFYLETLHNLLEEK